MIQVGHLLVALEALSEAPATDFGRAKADPAVTPREKTRWRHNPRLSQPTF